MPEYEFLHPRFLYLLLLLIPAIAWYVYRHNHLQADLQVPGLQYIRHSRHGVRTYFRHLPFILRILALAFLIMVLARPQSTNRWKNSSVEGIDMMLSLDISGSMLARDFSPNRIEASKDVAAEFINTRPNDRIGLVLFGGESFTQCPLTTDHRVLLNFLQQVNVGIIGDQSTAIGLGLANAVKRLKDSDAKSRVVILVTDGVNNAGSVDPLTAAEIAKTFGVRVYTIGVGTMGMALFPYARDRAGNIYYQQMPVEIDEDILKQIASMTDGAYFRATDNQKLKAIYGEIDQMEKTKMVVEQYSQKYEKYRGLALAALLLLVLESLIRNIFLRTVT